MSEKILVNIKKGTQITQVKVDPARLFLELAGGGYTVKQTAKAMSALQEFNETGFFKINGFELSRV